jgi:hypothetical protein
VEQAYDLCDNRPPLDGLNGRIEDQVVRAVRQEINHFKNSNRNRDSWGDRRPDPRSEAHAAPQEPAHANERPRGRSPERNPPVNQQAARPPPPSARPSVNEPTSGEGFNGRCPRCLQRGHCVCKCPNPFAVPRNDSCGWYEKHFPGCAQATAQDRERAPTGARPQGVVNVVWGSDPILPRSVEVQNDWMDSEFYPYASCSFNLTTAGKSGSGAFNGRCERCPPKGQKTRDCPSRESVARKQCCGGYGKHLTGCAQTSVQNKERAPEETRARGEINVVTDFEPLLPHSVEVHNNWTDAELYPRSSFTFKPAQPVPAQQSTKQREGAREVESESKEDDEYSSLEDEGEVFIRGALNKRKRGAPKEYLPKHTEPVINPLSVEVRVKRKEPRVMNREASRQRNLAMIQAIAGEAVEKLATHRHIEHFLTDLHKYIDLSFNHVKDVPETMNSARLEVSLDKDPEVPSIPETRARAVESARPSFVTGPNTIPLNTARPEGITNIKIDVDPKFDKTNYQTEIMIEIEQKPFRIIADSEATSSGINLSIVKLNLLASMKLTMSIPTGRRLGRWRRRSERWKFLCKLGRLWLKRIWLLCRLVVATTCCWVTS